MLLKYLFSLVLGLGLVLLPSFSTAAPMNPERVPDALKPWIGWVLHNQEEAICPPQYNNAGERFCAWPAHLKLSLTHQEGQFQQAWRLWNPAWVPLPGSRESWPHAVRVEDGRLVVVNRNGTPSIHLEAGRYLVSGAFRWEKMPEFLTVPPRSGLVALTLHGVQIPFPNLDKNGKLWLHGNRMEKQEEDYLGIAVHRKITDEIPAQIQTMISLRIAGKNREILLDQPLVAGFSPQKIHSQLPVRVEEDGRLRLQARPGNWTVALTLRHQGPLTTLKLRPIEGGSGSWAEEEVWVFESRNHLRMVSVEGVPQIDPQQTALLAGWRSFPAYLMRPGAELSFIEKKRGDPKPAPNHLKLQRILWLDFDGDGYTIRDHIQGELNRSWRLEMNPPVTLGRVSVNGQEQLITRLLDNTRNGVEVRQGSVDIQAESRLEKRDQVLPVVSWEQDFQTLRATLNLPPGWRIFHGEGVDQIQHTWINRWTLMDLFLTLIIALSVGKLFGRTWGVLALCALTLAYHEEEGLAWPIIHVLLATVLLRVVSTTSPLVRWMRAYRMGAFLVLMLIVLSFLVDQTRNTLYPQLELGTLRTLADIQAQNVAQTLQAEEEMPMSPKAFLKDNIMQTQTSSGRSVSSLLMGGRETDYERDTRAFKRKTERIKRKKLAQLDPHAQVQTGPGLPQWAWRAIHLTWNGPVERSQELHLLLMPPWINKILNLLRMVFVSLLTLRLLPLPSHGKKGWRSLFQVQTGTAKSILPLLVLVAGILTFSPVQAQAETPPPAILEALRQRLLEPPECLPQCADLHTMILEADEERLKIQLEAHVAHGVSIPLPGNARHWIPQRVLIQGKPAHDMLRQQDGTLWIYLEAGHHTLLLEGPLPRRSVIQIPLPLPPHRLTAHIEGWELDGVHENGLTDGSLQLRRKQKQSNTMGRDQTDFSATFLPPFTRLERDLVLDLTWRVENRLTRLTPVGSAVLVAIPLLPGESVTTPEVRVTEGKAWINLAADARQVTWESILEEQPEIRLTAPKEVTWMEVWRLQASPIWHIRLEGIPVIHHQDNTGKRRPEWRPWPNESIVIHVSRPKGVPGRTLTLVKSELEVTPGLRATDSRLTLHLRSSQGNQHALRLPPEAKLRSVFVNGKSQSINQEGEKVVLKVVPGFQKIQLTWREPRGMGMFFQTPDLDLGLEGVNAHLQLHVPEGRWVLWIGGPQMGPAILFWGTLGVILCLALGLGHIPWTPLKRRHWMLLGLGVSAHLDENALILAGWFLAMGWRGHYPESKSHVTFNVKQIILVLWTFSSVMILLEIIHSGLLGFPEMMISGNGSDSNLFQWYQDHTKIGEPKGWVISIPLIVYQVLMLLWSLWLASKILTWGQWAWKCYSQDGLWKPAPVSPKTPSSSKRLIRKETTTTEMSESSEKEKQEKPLVETSEKEKLLVETSKGCLL